MNVSEDAPAFHKISLVDNLHILGRAEKLAVAAYAWCIIIMGRPKQLPGRC